MARRLLRSNLERWEVPLIKAMLNRGEYNDQQILAYFTRPTRSINHRVISEIRNRTHHASARTASEEELRDFLLTWPDVDPQTGLNNRGDELLVKAREAMIAAVHIFNSAGLNFRTELFIVTAVISWTYLLHAFYKKNGIDYRYYKNVNGVAQVDTTKNGAEKYWELSFCLRHQRCPLDQGIKDNLNFLLEIRHEVEHRSTGRIDEAVSAKLQACCLNFNDKIKELFGLQYGLERRLPIALQFVTFNDDQRAALQRASQLPQHLETMMQTFHESMTPEQLANPKFAQRYAFIPKVVNRPGNADVAIEFVRADSDEAREVNRVLLKEVEKPKYRPGQIIAKMREEGFSRFNMTRHTELWRELDAKRPDQGFGVAMMDRTWYWYDSWLARVRAHCEENRERYQ